MHGFGEGFECHPIGGDSAEQLLDLYQRCTDFLALGPQAEPTIAMIEQDLAIAEAANAITCRIDHPPGRLVGVIAYTASEYQGDPETAYIELLMIAVEARNHGLGSAVYRRVETEIRHQARVKRICAHVQINNPAALRFWQRMGFTITGLAELQIDGTVTIPLVKIIAS